jgi:hypothetical protein
MSFIPNESLVNSLGSSQSIIRGGKLDCKKVDEFDNELLDTVPDIVLVKLEFVFLSLDFTFDCEFDIALGYNAAIVNKS